MGVVPVEVVACCLIMMEVAMAGWHWMYKGLEGARVKIRQREAQWAWETGAG